MTNTSEVLNRHFESCRPTPPHEVMRAQALEQAAKFGIPYEVAVAAINAKLCRAEELYCTMIEVREAAEGATGKLRAEVDAKLIADEVMGQANGERDASLAEIGAVAANDIRNMVIG